MSPQPRGVIAAGHPRTAAVGADVLRAGGNAVDAGVAAVLASFVCEPLLTGLGAGGYMLVVPPGGRGAVLLDFFVEAPGRGAEASRRAELVPFELSFGDAVQVFNGGPASVGAYGTPAGVCEAVRRFGTLPLSELTAPAVSLARDGVEVNAAQAVVLRVLEPIVTSTPECAVLYAPGGSLAAEGSRIVQPDLADSLELLGREGPEPFYEGEVAEAAVDWLAERGGTLTAEDLASYRVIDREPVSVRYRGREVLSNPPPSAGGMLLAYALGLLDSDPEPPSTARVVAAMEAAQDQRTPEFLAGLTEEGFADRFFSSRLGSTTHLSVLDSKGWACSVTCSNGSGSGVIVPGTGVQLNNMMGEQDLNPLGFHQHPPGRRMPSMMAPTVVLHDGVPELVLGSGGSNRIRSAVLQTILNVIEHGMAAGPAVEAPRVHFEDGIVYAEPGIDAAELEAEGRTLSRFRDLNLFFGGVHAVEHDSTDGTLSGGGDPRRGGAAVVA